MSFEGSECHRKATFHLIIAQMGVEMCVCVCVCVCVCECLCVCVVHRKIHFFVQEQWDCLNASACVGVMCVAGENTQTYRRAFCMCLWDLLLLLFYIRFITFLQ